jgi:hypothetical protein
MQPETYGLIGQQHSMHVIIVPCYASGGCSNSTCRHPCPACSLLPCLYEVLSGQSSQPSCLDTQSTSSGSSLHCPSHYRE